MAGSELVDYDRVADLYKQGRAMPDELVEVRRLLGPGMHVEIEAEAKVAAVPE